ncbi:hypothetical protein JC525_13800 [Alteromonas sp. IB21]|nr:hypothetical protein [Alteromonas sp. IB21]
MSGTQGHGSFIVNNPDNTVVGERENVLNRRIIASERRPKAPQQPKKRYHSGSGHRR